MNRKPRKRGSQPVLRKRGGEGQPPEHEGAGQGEGAAPAPGGHQWGSMLFNRQTSSGPGHYSWKEAKKLQEGRQMGHAEEISRSLERLFDDHIDH